MYFVWLMALAFLLGVIGVVSNPTPCYGALSLVLASGFAGSMVGEVGDSFSALILFLIYLGGMLVVFAYSAALSSDLYPGMSGVHFFGFVIFCFWLLVSFFVCMEFVSLTPFGMVDCGELILFDGGYGGVTLLYSYGGSGLVFVGVVLLMTLFVVLELLRWMVFGSYKT